MLSVQRRGRAHGSGRSRGGREMDGCVSGWIRVGGFCSLIAPLLCVLIKVSCDKTNVTNIFAGNKVREKKKKQKTLTCPSSKTIIWPPWVLGEAAGGRRRARGSQEAGAKPRESCPSRRGAARERGARREPRAVTLGCQAGPARVPSPSRTHLHLQPKQRRLLPATPEASGEAGMGNVR